ncbi:MAG: hypothetical protein Q7R95_04890 [bacterium]|nr:hypothetical protein [bacterium]
MLTKSDLKAIENLFDRKFDEKFDEKFDKKFDEKFDEKFESKIVKELKPMKRDINKIKKDLEATIRFFDSDIVNHDKRIVRIEQHLHLAPIDKSSGIMNT